MINKDKIDFYELDSELNQKIKNSNLFLKSINEYNKEISKIINDYHIEKEKNIILNRCGVEVLEVFNKDLGQFNFSIKEINEVEGIFDFDNFIKEYDIDENIFKKLKKENVGENPLSEIYKTYKFLYSKFYDSKNDLIEIGINFNHFIESLVKRLIQLVLDAGNEGSQKKFFNGEVVGLSRLTNNNFEFIKVPYYASVSTNMSLNEVKIKDSSNKIISLREIDEKLDYFKKNKSFFLPSGLGILTSIITEDNYFISQERNNNTNMVENKDKYISAASGSIPFKFIKNIDTAIGNEIKEEVGLKNIELSNNFENGANIFGLKERLSIALNNKIKKELNIDVDTGTIVVYLALEEKRRKPELVFLSITNKTLNEVKESWKNAEDKNESLNIKGFTSKEINNDLLGIKKGEKQKLDNHFYMSYLGYLEKS